MGIPFLADYLMYLRKSRGLAGSTIGTYLASISSVWSRTSSTVVSKSPELTAMLKSFRLEDHTRRFRPPAWDLNTVLQHLTSDVFEPLSEVDLLHLTQKTVFLLAMATAARVSELHAIDVTRITFDRGPKGFAHLALLWSFVAKNQSMDQEGRSFHIPPLRNIVGPHDREDLSLCPVRALRYYLHRTKILRKGRRRLFIPTSTDVTTEVGKNRMSFWIRSTILDAYKAAGRPPPTSAKAHETRALASSFALHSNVALTDILKGCFWRGDTTFANYYLRDLAVADVEGVHSFGPLVLAQQVEFTLVLYLDTYITVC